MPNPADQFDRLGREHVTVGLKCANTRQTFVPFEWRLGGAQNALHGVGHFRSNPVARDHHYRMDGHESESPVA